MFSESNSFNNSFNDNVNENDKDNLFCEICMNMLYPSCENRQLVYKCKSNCNYEKIITDNNKESNLVSRKEFLKEKNVIIDTDYALDPTMPRDYRNCPKCDFEWCVYMISTDLDDTKIEMIYICGDIKCGHYWKDVSNN